MEKQATFPAFAERSGDASDDTEERRDYINQAGITS